MDHNIAFRCSEPHVHGTTKMAGKHSSAQGRKLIKVTTRRHTHVRMNMILDQIGVFKNKYQKISMEDLTTVCIHIYVCI